MANSEGYSYFQEGSGTHRERWVKVGKIVSVWCKDVDYAIAYSFPGE